MRPRNIFDVLHDIFITIYNFFFWIKYPFYIVRDYRGKISGFRYTWYDSIDTGWRKAFGKKLLKDLKKALIKDKDLFTFRFADTKEKYGYLVLYGHSMGENTGKVLSYYEQLSICYYYFCGKPVRL